MKNHPIVYGIIGVLLGAFLAYVVLSPKPGTVANTTPTPVPMSSTSEDHTSHSSMTMDDMVNMLKGKEGDEFDKAFITGMVEHHQGAIDMAELAKQYAGHDEIKQMADEIISAQSNEIKMMQDWQKKWGY
jgi:uncharacterized protein (DUF305 family)